MSEWKEYRLGDIATFSYGSLPKKQLLGKGEYITYSGYKSLESSPEYNCEEGDVILVARGVGGTGDVKLASQKCYLTNLSIRISLDNDIIHNKYFYYIYQIENLRYLDSGSAQSQITIKDLSNVIIEVPSVENQKNVVAVLNSLDDKIDLLRRENATLEAMAETLFRQWFVVEAKEEWEEGKLGDICDYVTDKIDVTNINQDTYVSTENMCSNKQGIVMSSSKPQNIKVTKYLVNDVLLSNIRPYFKKIWLSDMNGGCSNDVLCIRSKKDEFKYFTYYNIRQDEFFDYVMLGSKGCKMPRGDKSHIMNWPIWIPSNKVLNNFNNIVTGGIKKIKNNNTQIQTLTQTRDGLLPKLMSNEVRITI